MTPRAACRSITDVLGLTSSFAYDAACFVTAMTTPYGTTTFAFGSGVSNGPTRFVEVTDPLGNSERVEYLQGAPGVPDSDSPIPNGINVFYFQDRMFMSGRNTFYWDKLALPRARGDYTKARIRHWLHDANDPTGTTTSSVIESTKYPLENRIWQNYPSQSSPGFTGNLDKPSAVGRVLDDGSTQLTQTAYNGRNMPTRLVDPAGRVSLYDYDSSNLVDLVSVKQEVQPSVPATIAQFTYNAAHRPVTYTDASGQTTTYAYNDAGQVTQATDPLGRVSSYEYDHLGYPTRIVNANDQTRASFTYDDFGRVATQTDSEGHTLGFSYDALDRLTQVIYPDGTFYEYTWDRLDLAAVKDRLGRVTRYSHDSVRNLTAVSDALANKTHVGYYGNGQLRTLTDAKGNTTSWERDLQGRVTAKRFADGREIAYGYELTTSRLKSVTDSLGQVKAYSYTVDDRLASIDYANAVNPTPSVAFVYDPLFPRVASMTDGSGETRYLYQDIGAPGALELSQEDGPFSHDRVGYRYDSLGRLAARTVDTSTEQFAYDALGRLVGHSTDLGAFEFAYLGQSSQRTQQLLAGSATGTSWAYGTNANDRRLTRIRNSSARTFQYATTPEDLVTGITEMTSADRPRLTRAWTYGYDAVDRLLTARPSNGAEYSYSYDAADNITAFPGQDEEEDTGDCGPGPQAAMYNSVNQLTSVGRRTLTYDANGNLTDDGARTYRWDAENRLVGITYKKQQGRRTTFRYDGLHRLVAVVSRSSVSSDEVRLVWCGDVICQARTAADVVTRRYYPEGEAWVATGRQLYYARDHVGSVRDVIDVGSGQRVASVDYDPYGNAINGAGRNGADFGFAGMLYHRDSGLYLTRNRPFDPRTGRWLSRNPLGEAGGVNLYAFAFDNPLRLPDPTGVDSGSPSGSLNMSTPDTAWQGSAR